MMEIATIYLVLCAILSFGADANPVDSIRGGTIEGTSPTHICSNNYTMMNWRFSENMNGLQFTSGASPLNEEPLETDNAITYISAIKSVIMRTSKTDLTDCPVKFRMESPNSPWVYTVQLEYAQDRPKCGDTCREYQQINLTCSATPASSFTSVNDFWSEHDQMWKFVDNGDYKQLSYNQETGSLLVKNRNQPGIDSYHCVRINSDMEITSKQPEVVPTRAPRRISTTAAVSIVCGCIIVLTIYALLTRWQYNRGYFGHRYNFRL